MWTAEERAVLAVYMYVEALESFIWLLMLQDEERALMAVSDKCLKFSPELI